MTTLKEKNLSVLICNCITQPLHMDVKHIQFTQEQDLPMIQNQDSKNKSVSNQKLNNSLLLMLMVESFF